MKEKALVDAKLNFLFLFYLASITYRQPTFSPSLDI